MKVASKFVLWTVVFGLFCAASLARASTKSKEAGRLTKSTTVSTPARGGDHLDNQGGPDGFGYRYVDNQSGDTATYNWIELRGDASATWLDFGDNPDDAVLSVPLSFGFPLYGLSYNGIKVSTNGNIQLATISTAFTNECLPASGVADRMICVLWDDLHLDNGGYDPGGDRTVAYRDFGDHIVVEWDSVGLVNVDNASLKFEAILWADGLIKMQYNQLVNLESGSQTIGIQAGGPGPSLQYVCDETGSQPVSGLAVWFYPGATGVLTGVVGDDGGNPVPQATVLINGLSIGTLTDTDGEYAFPMTAVGTYTVSASHYGYQTAIASDVAVLSGQTTHQDFTLVWLGIYTFASNDVPLPITDNHMTVSALNVDSSLTIADLDVELNLTHTFDGDLWIALVSPQNDTVVLSDHHGLNGDNYTNTIFDDEASVPIAEGAPPYIGPYIPDSSLTVVDGDNVQGRWELLVYDWAGGDEGELVSWQIYVTPAAAAHETAGETPQSFALLGGYPNPFNSSTTIRYVVPREARVNLVLYNMLGQEVRSLVAGTVSAGEHRAVWDGHDARGLDAATGVYLVRLESEGRFSTGKLLLLR